jgi:hypothetical protein
MRRYSWRTVARAPICPVRVAAVVQSTRRAAFEAGLYYTANGPSYGRGEASAYCAALAVEAVLAETDDGAAKKAIDAIEAAEWAVKAGDEPALYRRMADKLIQLIEKREIHLPAAAFSAQCQGKDRHQQQTDDGQIKVQLAGLQ